MYRVAKYLTLEQRRRAAAATYTPSVKGGLFPRDERLRCPLAVAIDHPYTMGPSEFANLLGYPVGVDGSGRVFAAVVRFMEEADDGKIVDIARAMGVKASK